MPKSRQRQRRTSRPYATPPTRKRKKASPRWYGYLVLGLIVVGIAVIVLNYMNFLPGEYQPHWLWVGLGIVSVGFIAATNWR
jgi:FtsH-binding integral membrane protein